MEAAPIGRPGWPLLAFCTASIDRKRMVLMQSASKSAAALVEVGWFTSPPSRMRAEPRCSVLIERKYYCFKVGRKRQRPRRRGCSKTRKAVAKARDVGRVGPIMGDPIRDKGAALGSPAGTSSITSG